MHELHLRHRLPAQLLAVGYYAIYDTQSAAVLAERTAFHGALHAVAAVHGWQQWWNSEAKSYDDLAELTLLGITDHPNRYGFIPKIAGSYNLRAQGMHAGGKIRQVDTGAHAGKWALHVKTVAETRGFDGFLPAGYAVEPDPSQLWDEGE